MYLDSVVLLGAADSHAESGVDLIEDQRHVALGAERAQLLEPQPVPVVLVGRRAGLENENKPWLGTPKVTPRGGNFSFCD